MKIYQGATLGAKSFALDEHGLPIKHVKKVSDLATGQELEFSTRCAIMDQWFNPDPLGEVTITVPEDAVDSRAGVPALVASKVHMPPQRCCAPRITLPSTTWRFDPTANYTDMKALAGIITAPQGA